MTPIKISIHKDFGNELRLVLFSTEKRSFLQLSFDFCQCSEWIELPYLQISMGCGRLFSFLLVMGKLSFSFDLLALNWS